MLDFGVHIKRSEPNASFLMQSGGLHHHRSGLEDGHGDLSHRQLLMVGLLGGDDRGVGSEHEVNTRVGHQVRLELRDVHVQGSIEAQGRRQARDDLSDEAVEVGVRGTLDVQVPAKDLLQTWVPSLAGPLRILQLWGALGVPLLGENTDTPNGVSGGG